jgi:hypothetical protein
VQPDVRFRKKQYARLERLSPFVRYAASLNPNRSTSGSPPRVKPTSCDVAIYFAKVRTPLTCSSWGLAVPLPIILTEVNKSGVVACYMPLSVFGTIYDYTKLLERECVILIGIFARVRIESSLAKLFHYHRMHCLIIVITLHFLCIVVIICTLYNFIFTKV